MGQDLFHPAATAVRVKAAIFPAKTDEDQRRRGSEASGGFSDANLDRLGRIPIFLQSLAESAAHGFYKPILFLFPFNEKKPPGLGVMGGGGPARGVNELTDLARFRFFREEIPNGTPMFYDLQQRFHDSNCPIKGVPFQRKFPFADQTLADLLDAQEFAE